MPCYSPRSAVGPLRLSMGPACRTRAIALSPRRDGNQRSAEAGALARFAPHCRRRHRPGRPENASVLRQERGARISPHAAGVTARALARWRVGCGRPCPGAGAPQDRGEGSPHIRRWEGNPLNSLSPAPPPECSSARSQDPVEPNAIALPVELGPVDRPCSE